MRLQSTSRRVHQWSWNEILLILKLTTASSGTQWYYKTRENTSSWLTCLKISPVNEEKKLCQCKIADVLLSTTVTRQFQMFKSGLLWKTSVLRGCYMWHSSSWSNQRFTLWTQWSEAFITSEAGPCQLILYRIRIRLITLIKMYSRVFIMNVHTNVYTSKSESFFYSRIPIHDSARRTSSRHPLWEWNFNDGSEAQPVTHVRYEYRSHLRIRHTAPFCRSPIQSHKLPRDRRDRGF